MIKMSDIKKEDWIRTHYGIHKVLKCNSMDEYLIKNEDISIWVKDKRIEIHSDKLKDLIVVGDSVKYSVKEKPLPHNPKGEVHEYIWHIRNENLLNRLIDDLNFFKYKLLSVYPKEKLIDIEVKNDE